MPSHRLSASEMKHAPELGISKLLSFGWGDEANGSFGSDYDFLHDVGAEALNCRQQIERVNLRGQWSGLAAAAVSRILLRPINDYGACGWSPFAMVGSQATNNLPESPVPGCLRDAVGFEWRPGIAIDGPVALALFGQCQAGVTRGPGLKLDANSEKRVGFSIAAFATMTDVGDVLEWGQRHAGAAAAFTQEMLRVSKNKDVRERLISVWATALARKPTLGDELTPQERLGLLGALSQDFEAHAAWASTARFGSTSSVKDSDDFERIGRTLFPNTFFVNESLGEYDHRLVPLLRGLTDEDRDAAWAMVLSQTFEFDNRGQAVLNALLHPDLTPSDRVLTWAKAWSKSLGEGATNGIRAIELDRQWEKPAEPSSSKRPRF